MSTAVFLGAGASKSFGYPITNEILPRILARLRTGELFKTEAIGTDRSAAQPGFTKALCAFLPGMADPAFNCAGVSITDLLTLVDRALSHGEARAGLPPEDLPGFRQLLERAIYEAILRGSDRNTRLAQGTLERFIEWLTILPAEPAPAVITTNYDTAVDGRLFALVGRRDTRKHAGRAGEMIDFGFSPRRADTGELAPRPGDPRWRLYKLHGSFNSLRCPLCGQIYIDFTGAAGSRAFTTERHEHNTCHCNSTLGLRLSLVTPSLLRTQQDPQLLGIWQAALEALRTANRWFIIGYSLPPEDVTIRSLFLRAWDSHANPNKPEIVVVLKDDKRAEATYRAFFPKNRLTCRQDGLSAFLKPKRVRRG